MRLLYFAPSSAGGIADYAHEQANALAARGVDVTVLCTPMFARRSGQQYGVLPRLREVAPPPSVSLRLLRAIHFSRAVLFNHRELAHVAREGGYRAVLFAAFYEYLAPLWSRALRRLARRGVVFGATVHDPVRDFAIGPWWWHRRSIAATYGFLSEAFVHEAVVLDTVRPMPQLRTTVVPHGIYRPSRPRHSRAEVRATLDLPQDAPVMLAFGSIRDNKNLDLVIRALAHAPRWYLMVAGETISSSSKPVGYYQALAREAGVADRCRWRIGFVPDEAIGDLFTASDLALLTYRASFHSQSGVLNTAVGYRTPCLASGGDGPMRTAVTEYALGVWVEPGSVEAIVEGLRRWEHAPPSSQWERYIAEHSWERNAMIVAGRFSHHALERPIP